MMLCAIGLHKWKEQLGMLKRRGNEKVYGFHRGML